MKFLGLCALATSVALALILPACSKSSSSGINGMFIQTCSLGCASGQAGFQVSCAVVSTYVNKDVSIVFSLPIDPSTIDSGTFQLIDVNTGQVPVGTRFVDPSDPHKVIFRPAINIDLQGNVTFGLVANTTYRIVIPGLGQNDPGPFIQSTTGEENKSRMQCDIQTSLGVVDYIPGSPMVQILVDTIDPATRAITTNVDAHGAMNVAQNSTIRFIFNDIMNPTTLADQVSHQAQFVTIVVDVDGDPNTTQDQVPVFGSYTISTDLALLQTTMTFSAPGGLPSAGSHMVPRKILINVPSNLTDLGGQPLGNPSTAICTPQVVLLAPTTLPDADGETFTDTLNLDADHSGADWGPPDAAGRLTRGFGGGSGRLGELIIDNQDTITLNTDSTEFPLPNKNLGDLLTNKNPIDPVHNPGGDYQPGDENAWPKITVTDGIFEFSSLVINPGGTLKITGAKPARVYSRGTMIINGTLDVSGTTAPVHMSDQVLADPPPAGGPNGGDGGAGSSRMDYALGNGLLNIDQESMVFNAVAIDNDAYGGPNCAPCSPDYFPDGGTGGGVGRSSSLGAASGGLHYPPTFPMGPDPGGATGPLGVKFSDLSVLPGSDGDSCGCRQSSSPGGGGSYATEGTAGIPMTDIPVPNNGEGSNLPTDPTPGGPHVPLDAVTRKLDADFANLRGGAGGGGGGLSLFDTRGDQFGTNCSPIVAFKDQSSGAGGGGGGAVQIVSGQFMTVGGTVLASGGGGGSAFVGQDFDPDRIKHAAPGGGGSGGAVRIQGRSLILTGFPAIDVRGGPGGTNPIQGHGGDGGAGLVRLEQMGGGISGQGVSPEILPYGGPANPDSSDPTNPSNYILSVGAWTLPRNRPDTYTASSSCWMTPALPQGQSYFSLDFTNDDLAANPPVYGWNMDMIYDSGTGEHVLHYRDPSPHTDPNYPAFPNGADFQTFLGDTLNHGLNSHQGSYLAVRFQGAVSKGHIDDFCHVKLLNDASGPTQIVPGSLTPWVSNPADLNLFSPLPNMVRFAVVFDKALVVPNSVASFIKGVTNLKIQVTPD